ncbi:hypothetical protein [Agrobacterium rosae]|uniref:SGNH hydrolase-type esterase domain-containing protein n=1 Tax=Agrobacterium rosae TaxID=1972867 RepID=A0A1R3THX9_9HYPH|nr:hypothetical protein [Agrobacterium rosae]SCX02634.1 hypothetical protein DSM25559_0244 [Agrobacterium rosae]
MKPVSREMLFTLGDSHSLWNFAGVEGAKIFWRGPITMHRAARDGIKTLIPKNCRPKSGDILVLSLGDIDCRAHVAKQAAAQATTTRVQVDLLCDRFEIAVATLRKHCPATLAISCILPPARVGLPVEYYPSEEDCFEDAKAIRDWMNHRLSRIAPLIDFREYFTDADGALKLCVSDTGVHIDSRNAQPVADAINKVFNTSFTTIVPSWPNVKQMAQPGYVSPLKKVRRRIKHLAMVLIRNMMSWVK